MARILLVDDEPNLLLSFEMILSRFGHQAVTAGTVAEAVGVLEEGGVDLVVTDIVLRGETGLDILDFVQKSGLNAPVVMMTGQPSIDSASEAVRLGAFEYLRKPVDRARLGQVVERALAFKDLADGKARLERENAAMRARLEAIFNSVSEGLATIDRDMRVMELNAAGASMLGISPDRAVGAAMAEILSPALNKGLAKTVGAALDRKAGFDERRVECPVGACGDGILAVAGSPLMDGRGGFLGLVLSIRDVTRVERLEERLRAGRRFQGIVGESPAMLEVYDLIDDLVDTETTVLITGESGTGKELVAEALHLGGERRSAPLVKVNCSALSESILESELFGHVRGAFTGALSDREGRFQMAEGGTIFLDEIGDVSPAVQLKLLRVLQDKEFERVGDNRLLRADVRVVAATNRDLADLVERGVFRQDLYYRLKVVEIHLPPLRTRAGDLPLLAEHFRAVFNRKLGKDIRDFSDDAMNLLAVHSWPGNVRELLHAVEHACIRCRGEIITAGHLPPEVGRDANGVPFPNADRSGAERAGAGRSLAEVMALCGGNKSRAARMLGVSRPTLYRRLREQGLAE